MGSKARALDNLKLAVERRDAAEAKAKARRARLFRVMFKTHKDGHATYRELSEITGLSEIRVAQILREERGRDE